MSWAAVEAVARQRVSDVEAYTVVASYEIVSEELDYRGAETAVVPTALGAEEQEAACRRPKRVA